MLLVYAAPSVDLNRSRLYQEAWRERIRGQRGGVDR
jgi:hypothetical protein